MSIERRLARLASQLLGDLDAADSLMCPSPRETEQQKLQLIVEAFEQVTLITTGRCGVHGCEIDHEMHLPPMHSDAP